MLHEGVWKTDGSWPESCMAPRYMSLNKRIMRNVINVLMESPIYSTLSLKERRDLLVNFMELYMTMTDTGEWKEQEHRERKIEKIGR